MALKANARIDMVKLDGQKIMILTEKLLPSHSI
jgi:hypothetical protein